MRPGLRSATVADLPSVRMVGMRAGSHDVDDGYLRFVLDQGRLIVAEVDAEVVGYAGAVPLDAATMISDLFVEPDAHGRGVGAALAVAVVGDDTRVQTCSSQHPAAVAVYRALGLEVRERLLYLVGRGTATSDPDALPPEPWRHGRATLVEWFRSRGATTHGDVVLAAAPDGVQILRLEHRDPVHVLQRVMDAVPIGWSVHGCVPESLPVARWMLDHGFAVEDHDLVMTTSAVEVDHTASMVHAGLW